MSITVTLTVPTPGSATFEPGMTQLFTDLNSYATQANAMVETWENVDLWVSGTTYAANKVVVSPTNFQKYRRKTAGGGTTDPASDSTNWARYFELRGYAEDSYTLTGTALDPDNGSMQFKTLSVNVVFTDSLNDGQSMLLRLEGGDSYTVTWPTMTWISASGDSAPSLTGYDVFLLYKDPHDSTLFGITVGNYKT